MAGCGEHTEGGELRGTAPLVKSSNLTDPEDGSEYHELALVACELFDAK